MSDTPSNEEMLRREIERLQKRVAELQQFHDWAEPQVTQHGQDTLEIERLTALTERVPRWRCGEQGMEEVPADVKFSWQEYVLAEDYEHLEQRARSVLQPVNGKGE